MHRTGRAVIAILAGLGLPLPFLACDTPSSTIDGGDLLDVFSRDAAADASKKPSKKDGGDAKSQAPDASVREPTEGVCVTPAGEPNKEISRTIGRPACRDAQILEWRDADGSPRYACVIAPKGADARAPLPLVVFFHDPEDDPTSVDKKTSLRKLGATFKLADEHPGFVVLAPQGRHVFHGRFGATFDSDYTGPDNVDVATVDHFVAELDKQKLVDHRRIYTLGASYGGHMAATYAMMRADRVAAFAAFATDEPRGAWSCAGPPPPAILLYRACDELFSCESVERWIRSRDEAGAETAWKRLGAGLDEEPNCATRNKCSGQKGTANHHRWPKGHEADILKFFAAHALAAEAPDAGG